MTKNPKNIFLVSTDRHSFVDTDLIRIGGTVLDVIIKDKIASIFTTDFKNSEKYKYLCDAILNFGLFEYILDNLTLELENTPNVLLLLIYRKYEPSS